jgi:hypothetical protein
LLNKNGVMPGQKREARLRAGCPGHPHLAAGAKKKDVDGRNESGHDDGTVLLSQKLCWGVELANIFFIISLTRYLPVWSPACLPTISMMPA